MKKILCCLLAALIGMTVTVSAQEDITDVKAQVSNATQTVTIAGTFGNRVSGRQATLQVLDAGIVLHDPSEMDAAMRENVIFTWQTDSTDGGAFTFTVPMGDSAQQGKYYYLVGGEYVDVPYLSSFDYVGVAEVNRVVAEINSAATAEALREKLIAGAGILGIDLEAFEALDDTLELQICGRLLGQDYESGQALIEDYEESFLYVTKQAELLAAIKSGHYLTITETLEKYQEYLEIDYSTYNGYSDLQKENVQKELAGKSFADFAAVRDAFYDAVEKWADDPSSTRPGGGGSGSGGGGSSGGNRNNGSGSIIAEQPPVTMPDDLAPVLPFGDLDTVPWAVDSILLLSDSEILNGYDDGTFRPNQQITREEFTKLIVSAFDLFDAKADCSFEDVTEDMWFYKFVASAFKSGVVTGQSDSVFGAGSQITRQDIAVMAYRAAETCGIELEAAEDTAGFSDESEIDAYALEAVKAMASSGIINGVGDNLFAPRQNATRAQAAKIVAGLLQLRQ